MTRTATTRFRLDPERAADSTIAGWAIFDTVQGKVVDYVDNYGPAALAEAQGVMAECAAWAERQATAVR